MAVVSLVMPSLVTAPVSEAVLSTGAVTVGAVVSALTTTVDWVTTTCCSCDSKLRLPARSNCMARTL